MAIKAFVSLTTLPTNDEQSGASPITVTSNGNSRTHGDFSAMARATFLLDVSAASGSTPTLDVVVEGKGEQSGKWYPIATFPQQTAATGANATIAPIVVDPLMWTQVRARWTVGGSSPSFTFSLGAYAMTEIPVPTPRG